MFSYLTKDIRCLKNLKMCFSTAKETFKPAFPHNYSPKEEEIILGKLNKCDVYELGKFSIAATRCKKLVAHRKKHGNFENLHQVLIVEGFGVKLLKSLCQGILFPKTEESAPARKTRNYNFVTPDLTSQRTQEMKNVVGVALGTLSVSWAGIDVATNDVYSWGTHALSLSPDVKRHHETQILEAAYLAHESLPKADTYVMESFVISGIAQQAANIPVNQQRLQLSTILHVLLNQVSRDRNEQIVLFQRNSLWCRLYGTLVGSERVSPQTLVNDMLDGVPGLYSPLAVPRTLIQQYYNSPPIDREAMCAALLLTTCFLDVCVRCKPECLSLLRGKPKR